MDLQKLKAFVVVAEELNFRKSAEILGMTQPPLTRLIASLEEELATALFERSTRKVKLTGAGVFLLKEARELLSRAETVEKELRAISKQKTGSLHIGFSTTAFLASLPKIREEFQDRFPKIKLELHQESHRGLIEGLKNSRFDVCFLEGEPGKEGFAHHIVQDEALGVLVPKKHPLAKRKEIELRDLKNETLILHPRKEHHSFFDTIHKLCEKEGFKPHIYIKNENESCPVLVAIGKGVSLTIASSQTVVPQETLFIPIKKLYLPVSAFWLAENPNPSLKSFLSFVIENASLGRGNAECLMDITQIPSLEKNL